MSGTSEGGRKLSHKWKLLRMGFHFPPWMCISQRPSSTPKRPQRYLFWICIKHIKSSHKHDENKHNAALLAVASPLLHLLLSVLLSLLSWCCHIQHLNLLPFPCYQLVNYICNPCHCKISLLQTCHDSVVTMSSQEALDGASRDLEFLDRSSSFPYHQDSGHIPWFCSLPELR